MKGSAVRLGRIFGIELRLDYSWFIMFVLVVWSLSSQYFPLAHPGWRAASYWLMGALTAILFFASVVGHELAHSLVSRAQGVPVHDITLFIFGGAAHIEEEPKRPWDELLMALAGPASSLLLAGGFAVLRVLTQGSDSLVHALALWLARINLILALFNLIPGFPLDGGRVFRAIVWGSTGNLRRATRLATGLGQVIAFGFIVAGAWQVFRGNWADGLWIAFIGWFLNGAATSSRQEAAAQSLLRGHKAREALMADCPRLLRRLTLDVVVEHIVSRSGRRCFAVVEEGEFQGLVGLHNIQAVPRERWASTRMEDVMIPRARLTAIGPDDELTDVLGRMADEGNRQYPVMENGEFLGVISRDHVLSFLYTLDTLAS